MSKDKRLEEKEKLDAEIARSLSVIKMKEAHKKIEDVEKSRKRAAILSINDRLSFNVETIENVVKAIQDFREDRKVKLDWEISPHGFVRKHLNHIMVTYESIRFDVQKNVDIKKEDFDRLFPKIEPNFSTYDSIAPNLICLLLQMLDMMQYCKRLF